jgi:hypothetical protein
MAKWMPDRRPAVARSSSWSGGSMRRRARLTRRTRLERKVALRRTTPLRRSTSLTRTQFRPASRAQRAKVAGRVCLVCGERPVDPAHLVPRSLGGCDESDCVVPLCRLHYRRYDHGQVDLLPYLEPRLRAELQLGLGHLGLLGLLRRVTGCRWTPVGERSEGVRRAA